MNPWLEPFRRSYQSIKEKLLGEVKQIKDENGLPLITDTSEGNIVVLLVSLFSAIAEVIHIYIDNIYRESFLGTSVRLDSVYNHINLIDYKGHMATPAVVMVDFTRPLDAEDLSTSYSKAKDSLSATDASGNVWYLDEELYIGANITSAKARFVQHSDYTLPSATLLQDGKGNPYVLIPAAPDGQFIEDGSLQQIIITNGGTTETYTVVKTLAYSKPTDAHCVVYSVNQTAISILFGDNLFGKKPSASLIGGTVNLGTCKITAGAAGNIPANSITSLNSNDLSSFDINNTLPSSGGTDYEDLASIQFRAPLSVKTLGVAVTKEDILNLVKLQPQVARAELEYICGQYIRIYISGLGNSIMNQALCDKVKQEVAKALPINTTLEVVPIQNRYLYFKAKVTGRTSFSEDLIRNQILNALYLSYNIASISTADDSVKGIRVSDIYALIDNLPSVDYLTIEELYITPWLEAMNGGSLLYITDFTLKGAKGTRDYIITFKDSKNYVVYPYLNNLSLDGNSAKVTQWEGTIGNKLKVEDDDFNFELTIGDSSTSATSGSSYKFQVIEGNRDIETQGHFNISIDPSKINLSIEETV